MPNITVEVERKTVDVYDSNFGQWTKKPASNPAWICYALLNTYAGVPESRILYNEFGDWATYCDELVDGQCRFSCNTIVDGGNFWDNIQKIARIGRASVMHRGSKYGVFVDRSESVVSHMFTMGNILDGTFNLQYLPQIDRANYIELEYTDPDKEYSRQIVGLYDQAYLGENEQQPAKVSFEAAIPREQVIREGIFRINSNKHLNRVISFEAGVYSFACRVGDLFYFQHEIVDYESANTGGRIVSADTSSVVIDQTVTIQTGVVYKLLVEFMDGSFVERTVTSLAGTTDTLTVSQPWGTLPEQHCQYLFGEAETYKKAYRLTSCEFRDDYTRSIVGIEYIEDIYTDDSAIIEDLDRPGSIDIARAVNVKAHEALVYSSDGSLKSIIKLSWTPLHSNLDTKWQIWMYDMTTGGPLFLLADNVRGVTYSIESINLLMDHEYKIAVINQGQAVEDSGVNTTFVTIMGKLAPPADVEIFVALWMSVQQQVRFSWSEIEDVDLKKYEIREGATWDTGIKIAESPSLSVAVDIESGVAETRTYFIKALDTSGIYSRVEKSTTVEIDSTGANILETIDLIQSDVGEALGYLDDWASDGVLSAVEKKSLRSGWEIRCAEYIEIKSRATDLGLTTQAFSLQTAFGAWGTYLNGGVSWAPPTTTPITDDMMPLWINNANLSIDQIVVRSDFNEEATTYFDVLVTAKMDIAEEINTNIAAAVNDASIAKGHIDDWASDGIFSSVEKKSFRSGWEIRCAEYLDLKAQATTLFLSAQVSVFETAFGAWGTYLNGGVSWAPPTTTPITDDMMPLWINNANLSIDQIVVRSDFNDNAANYFTALIAIKTAISTTVNNNISTAKDGAATALTHLQDWASDGIFSSVEKKSFRSGWEIRCAEYIDIKAQATSLGLTTQVNSLETAFGTWGKYINAGSNWTLPTTTPITDAMMPSWIKDTNLSTDQAITRSAFNDNASQYFDTLVLVKTAIANKLNSNTVNAGTTANWPTVDNKPTSIGEINAQELADIQAAKTDASTALEYLDDWAEDNKLTPVEKKALRSGMEIRFAEYLEIKAQATSLGLTSQATSLQTALNVWGKYLNNGATWTAPTAMPITNAMMPSWIKDANLSTMQTISRSAFNSAATTYFDALISVKTAITNKINSNITGAGTTANWSNIADDDGNRPADGADKTSSVLSPSSLAWKTTVSYAMLDETLIVGGFLKTSLIDVDNLKVKGSLIVGDIDYSKIDGGPPANADVTDYDAIYADTQDRIDALDLSNLEEDLIYSCIDFINLTAFGNSETADTWEFDSQFTGGAIIQIEIPDSFQGRIEASFNGTQLTTDLHESGQLGGEVVDILDLNRDGETIDLGSIS
ncbi:MAG: phage tail protein [Desulfobacterium sp.]|nr:phage tail protein [Desulfobacterium sp.]